MPADNLLSLYWQGFWDGGAVVLLAGGLSIFGWKFWKFLVQFEEATR